MLLHEAIEERALSDELALIDGSTRLSFSELIRHARSVAFAIMSASHDSSATNPVGVLAGAHWSSIVALLGVLETGRPYVPLDPAYPTSRLKHMAVDADVRLLLRAGLDEQCVDPALEEEDGERPPITLF